MIGLMRNESTFWYCLYDRRINVVNELGKRTGERIAVYKAPVSMRANVSPATGISSTEIFGNLDNYDKVIVTTDLNCPIDENSVLFIDKDVSFTEAWTTDYQESDTVLGDDTATPVKVRVPAYDYVVRRVARSLNSISIAVRKVTVS